MDTNDIIKELDIDDGDNIEMSELPPAMDEKKTMDEIFVIAKKKKITKKEMKAEEEQIFKDEVKNRLKNAREKKVSMKSTIDDLNKKLKEQDEILQKYKTQSEVPSTEKHMDNKVVNNQPQAQAQAQAQPQAQPQAPPEPKAQSQLPPPQPVVEAVQHQSPPPPPEKTPFQKMQERNKQYIMRKYYNIKI